MNTQKITVKQYDSWIEKGILTKYDRIELLKGEIVEKSRKTPQHCYFTDVFMRRFFKIFDDKVIVRNQNPIRLDEFSEPEPDIVLATPRNDGFEYSHPTPDEIHLILEVSNEVTLNFDRNTKGEAYSRAGIRQYLVLNVPEKTLEDYREPGADGFQTKQTYRAGQTFNLVAFPEISLQVSDFFSCNFSRITKTGTLELTSKISYQMPAAEVRSFL